MADLALKLLNNSRKAQKQPLSISKMKDNSKVIVNLLAGVAVGAALGILFAPTKGRNSRRKIDLFFTNFSDALIDNAENQYNLLDNLKDGLKYAVRERLEQQRAKLTGK